MKKLKLVCYGAGEGFKDFKFHLNTERAEIIGVIDRTQGGNGTLTAESSCAIDFDYVVICSRNYRDEMIKTLLAENIPPDKIVAAPNCAKLDNAYENDALMRQVLRTSHVTANLIWGRQLPYTQYDDSDYVRKAMLSLVAAQIRKRGIKGELAELGVCTGAFAKLISELFPEKKIYLFDTFEGFDDRDLGNTNEICEPNYKIYGVCDAIELAKYTVVEAVLGKMPFRDKCVIKKGYFPDTTADMPSDAMFSFVSIDADLYNPTIAGLKYFYPRLSQGGVIMVHDYGTQWKGVSRAVDEFAAENNIFPIPIPDECGSVLIVRP